jgi:dihydrofolate reductase
MPWDVPEDLARFARLTAGGAVVMGRRTWDALVRRGFRAGLPGRRNLVLSANPAWRAEGALRVGSAAEAVAASSAENLWVIGGALAYRALWPWTARAEVTLIDLDPPGRVRAPALDGAWRLAAREPAAGWLVSRAGPRYRFETHVRIRGRGPAVAGNVIVVAQEALRGSDAEQIAALAGPGARVMVLAPAAPPERGLAGALDHALLAEFAEAWRVLLGRAPSHSPAQAQAAADSSVRLLEQRGAAATAAVLPAEIMAGDPVAALAQAVDSFHAAQIAVVSRPRLVEDSVHRDLASRLRARLDVPVVHLYGGTGRLVD